MSIFTKFRNPPVLPEPELDGLNTEGYIFTAQAKDMADRAVRLLEEAARKHDFCNSLAEEEIDRLVDVQYSAQFGFKQSRELVTRLQTAMQVAD